MRFIQTDDTKVGADALRDRLKQALYADKTVLWLLSGGSNISDEAIILRGLIEGGKTDKLTVMLMDERFGVVGHADSNWRQLVEAGCDFTQVNAIPVMNHPEKSLEETVADYARVVKQAMDAADIIIGQFGLGADGHTAGILPNSPATSESTKLVVGYSAPPFVRITLTRHALARVDVAYVFAFGEAKSGALQDLRDGKKPFAHLPARLLGDISETYVYNDQIQERG